ncbi:MAG: hypothetical protein E5W81_28865, partial [Mesorhizobium sp.]
MGVGFHREPDICGSPKPCFGRHPDDRIQAISWPVEIGGPIRAAQKQSRNKILQSGKTAEKNQRHKWCRGGQVIGCDTRYGITDRPMQRFSISLMRALLSISLVTAAVE